MRYDRRLTLLVPISLILLGAQWSFGILHGYRGIVAAVVTSIAAEAALSRIFLGRARNLASAYMSGVSVSIMVRSPLLWPFLLCAVVSIMSKYVLRVNGRHIFNPSNLGICALLFLAPYAVAPLMVQWGNSIWPMLIIWVAGAYAVWRADRAHVTAAYVVSFFFFAFVRSLIVHGSFVSEIAPITGPMYQLFALFMVTDPKTTVSSRPWAVAVVVVVAFVEMILRLNQVIYAPFYALFLVTPVPLLVEMWWKSPARARRLEHEAAAPVLSPERVWSRPTHASPRSLHRNPS